MALVFAAAGTLSGCGGDDDDAGGAADMAMGAGGAGGAGDGVPAEFADLSNPFDGDADAIAAGAMMYPQCAACHGATGEGSMAFMPPATDFTINQSAWTDGYLFWRVRTGAMSGPDGSVMTAYPESALSDDQLWQVISYVRTFGAE